MTTTLLVTGGSGYLGRAVLADLLEHGYRVRALVRDPERLDGRLRPRVEILRGDLLDPSSFREGLRGVHGILHLAGLAADWVPDARSFELANVVATRNLLAEAKAARVPRVVATSTVMVLGPTDGLEFGSEETRPPPGGFTLPYQVTKAKALELCRGARAPGFAVSVVFPGALYGPGPLTEGNYLARVLGCLREGSYPALPKTAGRRWCLAHVEDVAVGHRLAFERGAPNGEWVLGGENIAFDTLLEIARDGLALAALPPKLPAWLLVTGLRALALRHAALGTRPPMTVGGGQALFHDWAFSSARAVAELGYRMRPAREAFAEFVRWFLEVSGRRTIAVHA